MPDGGRIEPKGENGNASVALEWQPIVPPPADAGEPVFGEPKPTKLWPYHNEHGELEGYVARFEIQGADGKPDKTFRPVRYGERGGKIDWHVKGWGSNRPPYRLPQLLAGPSARVIVCEGEKAADRAAALFPDHVATTSMNGAQSPEKTDWSWARGRDVTIWPDNDEAGKGYAEAVVALLAAAGALSTRVVSVPQDWPEGWDVADAPPDGVGEDGLRRMLGNARLIECPADSEPLLGGLTRGNRGGQYWPFRLTERGVEKEDAEGEWRFVCSRLEIIADTRDASSREWGRWLGVVDPDGNRHTWAMPMSMLAGDGSAYREELLSMGLVLAPGKFAREALHEYILTARPGEKARCVARPGWHDTLNGGKVFVLPDETFGDSGKEQVLLQTGGGGAHAFNVVGTAKEWRENVGCLCAGNSRLLLAVSASFAAPLLQIVAEESGGINFQGQSRTGKSTTLRVAGSVWGGGGINGYIKPWRATSNGLEGIAAAHCDAALCLDEMGQVDGREAGEMAYMLANGFGKSRARRDGSSRAPVEWRVFLISTGELSIADKMREAGKQPRAGQEVRLVDIPADAGAGLGIFETLHGWPNADIFARHLKDQSSRFYGTPIREFLAQLSDNMARDQEGFLQRFREMRDEFVRNNVPRGASGQVTSVAGRFALIAAAGELATAMGITGWPEDAAEHAARVCFAAWLRRRGGAGAQEIEAGIAQVRAFIESHGASRFDTPWDRAHDDAGTPIEAKIVNRAGFKKRTRMDSAWDYLITTETWKNEVCKGFDASAIAKELAARGLLLPGPDGRMSKSEYIPGVAQTRVYHVTSAILATRADGGADV
jgi:putative DNA primase/helicase